MASAIPFTSVYLSTSVDIPAFDRAIFSAVALAHFLEHAAMIPAKHFSPYTSDS